MDGKNFLCSICKAGFQEKQAGKRHLTKKHFMQILGKNIDDFLLLNDAKRRMVHQDKKP